MIMVTIKKAGDAKIRPAAVGKTEREPSDLPNGLRELFHPVSINRMELKNRAVMPAMGTGYSKHDSTVTDRLVAYLARRAQGGAGLIITEVCAIDPRGKGFPSELGIWKDDFIPGLSRIPRALHESGAKAAVQLHHAGRETFKIVAGDLPEAPSAVPSAILNQPCAEMSIERIQEIIGAFASAAVRAKQSGFDAVEIHGAHGYLVNQFLSPFSNVRTDAYGGSDENRARFAIEIIKKIREKTGPDFPILIRVSADELIKGGYDLSFIQWLAPKLAEAGVDAIHCSIGVYSTPGNLSIAGFDTEPGFNLFRARALKQVVKIPVIAVGRIADPRLADQAIARGDADLVSFGRQHLTDPDFLAKASRGDFDGIRFCLACNQGCIERLSYEMKSATCAINPECGKEFKGSLGKDPQGKKIWIVGAGPAGLSAGLAAVERGHQVTIFEREREPGGQLRSASKPPHKEAFLQWVGWITRRLNRLGVSIRLGQELTGELIASGKPDLVALASGAIPVRPAIPGINSENVCDAREILLGKVPLKSPAVVLGAGYVGMETADFLLSRGIKLTLLEMKDSLPVNNLTAHGYWLNYRLKKSGAAVLLGAKVIRIEPDAVVYQQAGTEQRLTPAALVVTAPGACPENQLEQFLKKLGIPFRIIGDAKKPRRLLEAVHEGFGFLDPEPS